MSFITMFSDSGAPGPGDQRGFKLHAPHFLPWLRNGKKPHHSSDLGLNGPYKCSAEPRNNLTPLERARGMGFLSKELIQRKDREKKGELRCNGVGLARRLPAVLRGNHILPESPGKRREDGPARRTQSPDLDPDSNAGTDPGDGPQGLDNSSTSFRDYYSEYSLVRNHHSHLNLLRSQNDGTSPSARKYGPLLAPAPVPAPAPPGKFKGQEPNCKVPVVACTEDGRGKLWHYARHTYHHRDLHSSSWLSSDTQGLIDRRKRFSSSFSYIKEQGRNSQSHRDLTGLQEPPVEGFNGRSSLHRVIFSTEIPQKDPGCTTTLQGPRKPRPSSERTHLATQGQNQTWVQPRLTSEGEPRGCREEAGHSGPRCSRKAVRNQIQRVVDNLEQVLGALKDVHQEMKEVVEQIDNLTSSIDLNEEEQEGGGGGGGGGGGDSARPPSDSGSSSSSSSSGVTVGSNHQRPSEQEDKPGSTDPSGTLRRGYPFNHSTGQSPSGVLPQTQTTEFPSEKFRTLRFTRSLGSAPKQGRPPPYTHNPPSSASSVITGSLPPPQSLTSHDLVPSPQRDSSLPVCPPTPGLHHPNITPGSQPQSPGPSTLIRVSPVSPSTPLSPKPPPPPTLSPSVIIETKAGSYRTSQSDHPSASPLSPSMAQPPAVSCPPRNSETQTLSNSDGERQASSTGIAHLAPQECTAPTDTTKTPTAQGRRGRKPPPYPHNRLYERMKKAKEPCKAPPYPEKRRLLSTTV